MPPHPVLDDPEPRARLPLYDASYAPEALGPALPRNPSCPRCDLGSARRHVKNVCLAGGGDPGGLLVVLESPTQGDDAAGKFSGAAGVNKTVAGVLAPYAASRGPIRYVWAVSCPGKMQLDPRQVDACRPYLSAEVDSRPTAILAMGPDAALALTGNRMDARWLRRGWSAVRGIPCYFFASPYLAAINRFHKQRLASDVRWALTESPPFLDRKREGSVRVGLDAGAARELLAGLDLGVATSYDVEHWPRNPWANDLVLLSIGLYQRGRDPVVIPGSVAPEVIPELRRILGDPATPKVTSNGKHDRAAMWRSLRIDVRGGDWDTQIVAQLMASDDRKGLGYLAWQVGLGGIKAAGQEGADDEDDE